MYPTPNASTDAPTVPSRAVAALDLLRRQLTARLAKRDALVAFAAAKLRHPDALTSYANPMEAVNEVIARIGENEDEPVKLANAILQALVIEYQSTGLDAWAAALILTAGNAMRRFAFLARSRRVEPDELVQRMVESLLLVAREHPGVSDETHLAVYLRREMSRHAFEQLKRGRRDRVRTATVVDEALARRRVEPFADARDEMSRDPVDQIVERQELKAAIVRLGPMGVRAILGHAPSLKMLTVLTRYDLTPSEQTALYQQIKRWYARCRALGAEPDELPPWWLALGEEEEDGRNRP